MKPYGILLIDDHTLFRTGLRMVLESAMADVEIAEAASPAEIPEQEGGPELILLDIQLPELNGLDAMDSLRERWPEAAIVVLSAFQCSNNIQLARQRGARAFLSKSDTGADIVAVIEDIRRGRAVAVPPLADEREMPQQPRLTARQCEVLDLMARGHPNKVIARELQLSENTVRWHVQALLGILGAGSRTEAVFIGRSSGLIG
ncbi:response regulator [Endothiovibrio diazotrophicus]